MAKLQTEFMKFHSTITIDEETEALKEKRNTLVSDIKEYFPKEFKQKGYTLQVSDIEIFDQGSYAQGIKTTIKSSDVDRDIAVAFPLDRTAFTAIEVKKMAKICLDRYNRTLNIKRPCITVDYQSEPIHIDFPIYAKSDGYYFLAKGKTSEGNGIWEQCDPKQLNTILRKFFEGEQGIQFRRIVRYLKKWKLNKFHDTKKNNIPPSIGLTLMANNSFCYIPGNDLQALSTVVSGIMGQFSISATGFHDIYKQLPALPYSDVFFKMDIQGKEEFFNKLKEMKRAISDAISISEEYEAAKILRSKVFGNDFPLPAKPNTTTGIPRRNNSFA